MAWADLPRADLPRSDPQAADLGSRADRLLRDLRGGPGGLGRARLALRKQGKFHGGGCHRLRAPGSSFRGAEIYF
jgi:hypothetical protein